MKTAVEWLQSGLELIISHEEQMQAIGLFEQAKAMEKEQIKNAYLDGFIERQFSIECESEQYYNETYKSENIVMFMTTENGEIESIILTDNPDCGVKGITFKSE